MNCMGHNFFSKIGLNNDYYQIRMKEGDEWKNVFKTTCELYEWLADESKTHPFFKFIFHAYWKV